jgi:hypothetical protein
MRYIDNTPRLSAADQLHVQITQSVTDVPFQHNRLTRIVGDVFLTIMSAKKTKPKKKAMTLDDFAVLIQKDLARMATKDDIRAIRKEMATKDDLQALRDETRKEFAVIREQMATKEDLAAVSDRISVAKEQLQEQISGLKYARKSMSFGHGSLLLKAKSASVRTAAPPKANQTRSPSTGHEGARTSATAPNPG